jgi:hypothetical protein
MSGGSDSFGRQVILSHLVNRLLQREGGNVPVERVALRVSDYADLSDQDAADLIDEGADAGIYTLDRSSGGNATITGISPQETEPEVITEAFGELQQDTDVDFRVIANIKSSQEGQDVRKEVVDDFPQSERRRLMLEREGLIISLALVGVLEVRGAEIGVAFVLMPASMDARIRVAIVDAEPIGGDLTIPGDGERRRFWACLDTKANGIERRSELLCFRPVREELNATHFGHTVKDVSFELIVQVRVGIAAKMWDPHGLIAGLYKRRTGTQEVPLANGESDNLEPAFEVFPGSSDVSAFSFFVGTEVGIGDSRSKFVRRGDIVR